MSIYTSALKVGQRKWNTPITSIVIQGSSPHFRESAETLSNHRGQNIVFAPGAGVRKITVVDYTLASGDTVLVRANGKTTFPGGTFVEGVDFTASVSNAVTAASLAATINAALAPAVRARVSGDDVILTKSRSILGYGLGASASGAWSVPTSLDGSILLVDSFGNTDSVVVGLGANSNGGGQVVAIGRGVTSSGNSAVVIGSFSTTGQGGIAIGKSASTSSGIAIGSNASAPISFGIAIGLNAATPGGGVSIGTNTFGNIAIGASSTGDISIGAPATSGGRAIAIGHGSSALGFTSVGIGWLANAAGLRSVAIGDTSSASGQNSVAVGSNSVAGVEATALGWTATASGTSSLALGRAATASANQSIAIGNQLIVSGLQSIGMGTITDVRGQDCIGIGYFQRLGGGDNNTFIGANSYITQTATITVLDYTQGSGDYVRVSHPSNVTLVEGTHFDSVTSNDVTAENIRAAYDAKPTLTATRIGAVVTVTTIHTSPPIWSASSSDTNAWTSVVTPSTVANATALGQRCIIDFDGCIAIGSGASPTAANQCMVGSASTGITTVVIGGGDQALTPSSTLTYRSTDATPGGANNDKAGTSVAYGTGAGTGIGLPATMAFQTPTPGVTGSVAQVLANRLELSNVRAEFSVPPALPSFAVLGAPSAVTAGAGAMIYVTDETGGAVPAFSDGANWLRVTDRNAIS